MIENIRQYDVANEQVKTLEAAYECSKNTTIEMPKDIYDAMLAGIQSQIDEMKQEIKEFEAKHE
jgi:hypothetical protein